MRFACFVSASLLAGMLAVGLIAPGSSRATER